MQKRNVLSSPRLYELKKRRRRAVWSKILISLFGIIVIFILSAYLSRLSNLNISDIQITGNNVLDTEALKTTVSEQLAGKYLWLFPRTNILFYPQSTIKSKLQNKFKRIKDIDLTIKYNKTLIVSISEREAKYLWCGNDMSAVEEKCYFTDEDGYVFDEAPYFSGEVYFKLYGTPDVGLLQGRIPTSENTPLGSSFVKENFSKLISFKDILIGIGLKPVALYVEDNGDANIFLSSGLSTANEPKIIFRADADLENVAGNLEAALRTEPLQSKFKNKYSSLEYIDLRFGNKVYDKFL